MNAPSHGTPGAAIAYRADIDGLRAVAVLAVIGFHAFPGRVPGGFSGVDVFFVVSGYLIAADIVRRQESGTFSLGDFYARRVRRLFPALLTVLLACVAFGAIVLLPDEFQLLLVHAASSAGFVENFRLLSETGYFDTGSASKPLLHIWSLAIEEQFYLLCPLLLLAVRAPALRFALVVGLALLSFTLNIVVSRADPASAYYLPQTRAWEILIGMGLSLWPGHWRAGSAWSNAAAAAGAALLVAGIWLIDRERRYPGWWALLPTVGTALLIVAGPGNELARRALSHPWLRSLGLVSYPLYLWHWPLLAFLRIVGPPDPTTLTKAAALLASAVLAVLTYRVIELPVRRGQPGRRVPALTMAMAGVCALAATGASFEWSLPRAPGLASAEEERRRDLNFNLHLPSHPACDDALRRAAGSPTHCLYARNEAANAAVLGDSHAYALFYGLADVDRRRNWLVIASSSCPPFMGVPMRGDGRDCSALARSAIEAVSADANIATVVLTFLASYTHDVSPDVIASGLERTVATLAAAGKHVVIHADVPELPFSPRDCVDRPLFARRVAVCQVTRDDVLRQQAAIRQVLQTLVSRNPSLDLYDPLDALCDARTCAVERGDMLLYRDHHHLSIRGSRHLAVPFLAWLDQRTAAR
ncbi:MAG: acyltransferase family protein [Caldimonas sp.]